MTLNYRFLGQLLIGVMLAVGLRASDDVDASVAALLEKNQGALVSGSRGANTDWPAMAGELSAVVDREPDYDCALFADRILHSAMKNSEAEALKVAGIFAASENTSLHHAGVGRQNIARLRTEPIEMRFTALDGTEVDLEKCRGRVVLLQFWATWCSSCKQQLPLLRELYAKYHEAGFDVFGITMEYRESDRAKLRHDIEKYGITWPQFFDGLGLAHNEWTNRYAVMAAPTYFLIGPDGRLVSYLVANRGLDNLEGQLRRLLGLAPEPAAARAAAESN